MTKLEELYTRTIHFIELLDRLPFEFGEDDALPILNEFENLNNCYMKSEINCEQLEKLTYNFTNSLLSISNKTDKYYFEELLFNFKELSNIYINLSVNNVMIENHMN